MAKELRPEHLLVPGVTPDLQVRAPEKLLQFWNMQAGRAERRRNGIDYRARLNMAFMLGNQWIWWDERSRQLRRAPTRRGDPNAPIRMTINLIGSRVERAVAKLTKHAPVAEVRPVSAEPDDEAAAEVGTRILASEMDRMHFQEMLTELYFWVIPVGHAYIGVFWNPDSGSLAAADPASGAKVREGQIELSVVPHFELAVDPGARHLDDAQWVRRTVAMHVSDVFNRWGVIPKGPSPVRTVVDELRSLTPGGQPEDQSNFISVHQVWMRPGHRTFPPGMVLTYSGSTLLDIRPYPYTDDENGTSWLPFVQFDMLPGAGNREGRTWVDDMVPMQVDYNDARSREAEYRRRFGAKLLYARGSIDPERVTSRVEMIDWNPASGFPPQLFEPSGAGMQPSEITMDRAEREMDERSGQQDVSRGDTPGASVPSAAAILTLQEADDTKLALSAKLQAGGIERLGWRMLMLARKFWTEERQVRTWSENSTKIQVERFRGSDIPNELDVHVSPESSLPRSKVARLEVAKELKAMFGDRFDDETFIRMLDLPGTDLVAKRLSLASQQAARENEALRRGVTLPVEPWHDHAQHYREHNNFRMTTDYEDLQPEDRAAVDAHAYAHELALAGMMAPEAGAEPGAEGAAGAADVTGRLGSPVERASGATPSASSSPGDSAAIGGPGQPGAVPGASRDQQAGAQGD